MGIDYNECFGFGLYIDNFTDDFVNKASEYCEDNSIDLRHDGYYSKMNHLFVGFLKYFCQNKTFEEDNYVLNSSITFTVTNEERKKLEYFLLHFSKDLENNSNNTLQWQIYCFRN
jgi:hypothetical protein